MAQDFERRVRETLEKISRSPEAEHVKKDLKNMARDIQKEFSSYQNNRDYSNAQSGEYQNGPNSYSGPYKSQPYQGYQQNSQQNFQRGTSHYSSGSTNKNPYSVGATGKSPEPQTYSVSLFVHL